MNKTSIVLVLLSFLLPSCSESPIVINVSDFYVDEQKMVFYKLDSTLLKGAYHIHHSDSIIGINNPSM